VLASDPRITKETAERVRRAAAELGYRPNRLARGLKRGQSPIFGILNFMITQPYYAMIIREFEARARAEGFACVVCDTGRDDAAEREALDFLLDLPVRGVLLVGDRRREATANALLADVWRAGTAVAAIGGAVPGTEIPRVTVDAERTGYLATRHLLDGGHRRVAFVPAGLSPAAGTVGHLPGRRDGFARALLEAGLEPDPRLVVRMEEVSRRCAHDVLDALGAVPDPPTAIFAHRDEVALALIGAAAERGVRVPEELAVVGVDNLPIGELVWPTLTTIAPPIDQLAALALDALLRRDGVEPVQTTEPTLIVRRSSQPSPRP
jgi:DNA-binding LacI/PurR family transcriptional regulator